MDIKKLLSAAETADILGISAASVENWVKQGYLDKLDEGFVRNDVEELLKKIRSGKIDKLSRRANKRETAGNILPANGYAKLCKQFLDVDLEPPELMWLTAVKLFKVHGLSYDKPLRELAELKPSDHKNTAALHLLKDRFNKLKIDSLKSNFRVSADIIDSIKLPLFKPADTDIAGIIYQAVSVCGNRSATGSFFTPGTLAEEMIGSALEKYDKDLKDINFIDPCCGSGQFLLSFLKAGGSPDKTVGIDSDATAAFTAAVNIILQCPEIDSSPLIFTADSLIAPLPGPVNRIGKFDMTITNPPWGAATTQERDLLSDRFPAVASSESFSYFINRCIELIKPEGLASFVLPESVTNVKRHSDIRKYILEHCRLSKINYKGRIFRKVFTAVVTMELVKAGPGVSSDIISSCGASAFNINLKSEDNEVIDRIYSRPHLSLRGKAEWALGIVTGNNKRFIKNEPGSGFEPIIKGRDITAGAITAPSSFIRFEPDIFQQCAPEWKYRSSPKLVYRFISNRPVFAVDTKSRLTLNSANIIIPGIELTEAGWSPESIIDFFNSEICSFIFKKRFNSVKVLRSHIEQLPLPTSSELNFGLTEKQMHHILNSNQLR